MTWHRGWVERMLTGERIPIKEPSPPVAEEPVRAPQDRLAATIYTCPFECGYTLTVGYGAYGLATHSPERVEEALAEHMGGHTLAMIVEAELGAPPSAE